MKFVFFFFKVVGQCYKISKGPRLLAKRTWLENNIASKCCWNKRTQTRTTPPTHTMLSVFKKKRTSWKQDRNGVAPQVCGIIDSNECAHFPRKPTCEGSHLLFWNYPNKIFTVQCNQKGNRAVIYINKKRLSFNPDSQSKKICLFLSFSWFLISSLIITFILIEISKGY